MVSLEFRLMVERIYLMMNLRETPYGLLKRLRFIEAAITHYKPSTVLDYGCGTGAYVTIPLAQKFPHIQFIGADNNQASITHAASQSLENIFFIPTDTLKTKNLFDLIIVSEVIEHVTKPEETLKTLAKMLPPTGRMILTIPNGYGPFEIASTFERFLIKRGVIKSRAQQSMQENNDHLLPSGADTLANSPHINFFTMKKIRELIKSSGLQIILYRPRTFLCGFGFDKFMRNEIIETWNSDVADILPSFCVSGWMFVLKP